MTRYSTLATTFGTKWFHATNFFVRLLAVWGAAAIALPLMAAEPASERPNILVILVDDLGYGDLSSYGAADLKSPHIDRLAREGMTFNNFYANCPVCSPTRASLLTGKYPDLVGVPGVIRTHASNNWGFLAPQAITLPQVLNKAGYHTAMVGKWHLGLESPNLPNDRGFDYFHGFLGDMMDDYYHHRRHENNYMRKNGEVIDPEGHATDLFSDWAIEFLKNYSGTGAASTAAKNNPFFLYLAYNAPHTPIQPPREWVDKVTTREPGIDPKRARLVALIEHLDYGIGRVLHTLRETGLAQNTLVIFTSDNGGQINVGANNGPWRDGKQSMYEGGLRVPACAVWPGKIKAGSKSDHLALTMDIFPTVLEAAGVAWDHDINGRSFLRELRGEEQQPHDGPLFFVRREGGDRYQGMTTRAVRLGPWKLVRNSPFTDLELFDLTADPQETKNVRGEHLQVFRRLSSEMRSQIQRAGAIPWQKPNPLDE